MFPRLHLSEATIERLSRMLREWESGELSGKVSSVEEPPPSAPDLYLARAGINGIPGLITDRELGSGSFTDYPTGTGTYGLEYTGTGEFGDGSVYPGTGTCKVHALKRANGIIQRGPIKEETVYNLGYYVPPRTPILISRDRSGLWWVVKPLHRQMVRGVLNMTLTSSNVVTMDIWELIDGVETDTGERILVRPWMLTSGQSIPMGREVMAHWDEASQAYYVGNAECP